MTREEFEELKGKIFRDIETIKSNRRRQPLPRRSATIATESQRVGILPPTTLVPLKQQLAAVLCTMHQAPLASATLHLS